MELKVDYNTLKVIVRTFSDQYDLLEFIKAKIDYLYTHNNNYNNGQWVAIQDLKDIFDYISIKEK